MLLSKININKKNKKIVHWYGFDNFYKFFPEILVKKIKKFFSIKLFSIQKGFDKVIKKNGDDAYFKILEEIENIDFDINELKFSKLIFGINIKKKELILKQFLIKYFYHPARSDLSISRSLLTAIENNYKLTFPLHKNYFRIFEKKNIKINKILCLFLWYLNITIFFLYGVKIILYNIYQILKFKKNIFTKGVYFQTLPEGALNLKNNINDKINYFSFIYLYYKKNNLKLKSIFHSTNEIPKFEYQGVDFSFSEKYNLNFSLTKKMNYLFWSLNAIIICLFDLFRGRWWNSLMLSQAADRKIVELLNNECIHDLYLFNNTNGFSYRPMWTYESEKKGSKTVLYFYSLNYNPLTKKLNNPVGLSISNWKYISVWDNAHATQLKSQIKNSFEIFSYEPIFLDTGYEELKNINHKFVTIFDVTPLRPIFLKCNYFSSEYYTTKNVIKFIDDIIFISKKYNIKTILKIKRISSLTDKYYLNYLNNKIMQNELIVIQENVSTISLIKNSKLVISYPLTSITKLSEKLNVNNIFYSPIDIKIDQKLLLESRILYNKDQLNDLFTKIFI